MGCLVEVVELSPMRQCCDARWARVVTASHDKLRVYARALPAMFVLSRSNAPVLINVLYRRLIIFLVNIFMSLFLFRLSINNKGYFGRGR